MLVVFGLTYILSNKRHIDKQLIELAKQSKSVDDLCRALEKKGYENYIEHKRLMVKVNGVWNTFYFQKYLGEDIDKENGKENFGSIYGG